MDKKYGILIVGTVILFLCFVGDASAKTWYVDDDGGSDFIRIQDAITKANESETIIVRDGTYTENIDVNKRLTIQSENGSASTTVQATDTSDHVFEITADYVNISGFTVKNSTCLYCAGISLNDVDHCNISYNNASNNNRGIHSSSSNFNVIANNTIVDNGNGIFLNNSRYNIVRNNIALNNSYGIYLLQSSRSIIENNIALNNYGGGSSGGIILYFSNNNTVDNNNASNNSYNGIYLSSSINNIIGNNIASNNSYGIYLAQSTKNIIENNTALNNYGGGGCGGIILYSSNNNTVDNNNASNNYYNGIYLGSSINNTIGNNIASNNTYGIYLWSSLNNTIENNTANSNNGAGISLWVLSNNNTIKNNNASSNECFGIFLASSNYNTITGNYASSNNGAGISLGFLSNNNTIKNNNASSNEYFGIFLASSNYNIVTNNDLFSNSFGLGLITFEFEDSTNINANNNQIINNNLNFNKYCGMFLWNLRHFNNITSNNASNNNLFGIAVLNSTNQVISNNTANSNERGFGLDEASEIKLINNVANTNKISGFSLFNSSSNTIFNNSASFNTYEGIYLSNSSRNNISSNNVSFNYFGISLYSSKNNSIINNVAESNYYFEVFLHPSKWDNTIINNTWYIQEDIVRGVRLYVLEARTPSLQIVEHGTNATYYIVAENLGNSPDTYDLNLSSMDNPELLSLDKDSIFLGAGEMSTNTTTTEVEIPQTKIKVAKTNIEAIKLTVGDTAPGIYRVKVEIISRNDNTVKNMIETRTIVPGQVASVLINSPKINKSAIIKSSIKNSIINTSAIINSIISNSTITGSIINNSEVVNTSLNDVIVEDANISNGNIFSGNITINEIKYEISNVTRISELIIGSDYSDSNLVGITKTKTLNVYAENSNLSFDIYAEKDYFAGSLSVQKSTIPPNGIPEFTNNVGGYVYANASDNLANSTGWLRINVYYGQNELGDLNESSLRLRYFNESAGLWENISIYGANLTGKYVWGNISHYSVFALIAQPPPPPSVSLGPRGGGRPEEGEITIPIANPGINIFNFEWLGLDITKISIDLKSVTINAKVALKKVDKPAEIPDPQGIVYGYFDISANLEPENIHSTLINFRVHKSWTAINDVSVDLIKLYRYANGWEELKPSKIKEDDDYLYFSAETPALSLFVITGEKRAVEFVLPTPTQTPPTVPTTPSPTPAHPAPVPVIGWFIIVVAIVATAIIVAVTYLVLRRKKA
jgi:PGF-pre-PGF domain-containing protein